jgi:hypothetical protein
MVLDIFKRGKTTAAESIDVDRLSGHIWPWLSE